MQWTREKVLRLIEAYRKQNILWDPANKNYFNRILKDHAWVRVSREMENAPAEELKKKVENLLAQMRREKVKMRKVKRQGSDEIFTSSWYAFEPLKFLLNRSTKNRNEPLIENMDTNPVVQKPPSPVTKYQPNQSTKQPVPAATKRKQVYVEEQDLMESASSSTMVNDVSPNAVALLPTLDGDQLYANFIASKFRMYSQRTKNVLQHQISNLLFRADSGDFDYHQPCQPCGYNSPESIAPSSNQSHQLNETEIYLPVSVPESPTQDKGSSDEDTKDSLDVTLAKEL